MRYLIFMLSLIIVMACTTSMSYEMGYTGVIINTNGNTEASYVNLKINDGTNRYIQATYILDTRVSTVEDVDLYQIYAIAGRNPLIIEGNIDKNEIIVKGSQIDTEKPIILII